MRRGLALLLTLGLVAPALAEPPRTSLRPVARPMTEVAGPTPAAAALAETAAPPPDLRPPNLRPPDPRGLIRPQARPVTLTAVPPRQGLDQATAQSVPPARETRAERRARERAERRAPQQGGGLCGDAALVGEVIGAVSGPGGCGIDNAVRLRAVSGIRLSTPATIDCTTARALKRWVHRGLLPEAGRRGGGVAELRVAASYACRGRNNQPGARLSEHSKGHAIDISAITFRDGSSVSVLKDWSSGRNGRLMKSLHRAACGPFGTVLGPNSDRFHRDHFHFDTARHRSGPYCK